MLKPNNFLFLVFPWQQILATPHDHHTNDCDHHTNDCDHHTNDCDHHTIDCDHHTNDHASLIQKSIGFGYLPYF